MSPGSEGKIIGAKVLDIEQEGDKRIVNIKLPESYDSDIELIKVQRKDETYLKQPRIHAPLIGNYGKPVGIRIFLKRSKDIEFRLRMTK